MVELFGRERSRREINERTGALQQVAGVELLEYADWPERGVRGSDFRTGAGLELPGRGRSWFRPARRRLSGRADRLALADRAAPPRPRLNRGEPRLGVSCARSPGCSRRVARHHALAPATSSVAQYIYPGSSRKPIIRCTAASRRSRRACSATASAGRAIGARCGPRPRSPRWRCSART